MTTYSVFIRCWYKRVNGKLVPNIGRKTYIARSVSLDRARQLCDDYNNTHNPGTLQRKAEFQSN